MNPRVNYEMTEEDLEELMKACNKPTPLMYLNGGTPIGGSAQENANMAWAKLGTKMGFDSMTVRPSNEGRRFFSAVPSETEVQQQEREQREVKERRQKEIEKLQKEITERQEKLECLQSKI